MQGGHNRIQKEDNTASSDVARDARKFDTSAIADINRFDCLADQNQADRDKEEDHPLEDGIELQCRSDKRD